MNPVGYFLYDQQAEEWEETYAGTPNSVPLYKHPAELTDEEIITTIKQWAKEEFKDDFEEPETSDLIYMISLAKAILRKAQEK